jgi:uncharacterized protein YdeI (YjbR/CyaY-like superfamily)
MKPKFFATPARFRAWLETRHATETELLVGFYKKSIGKPSITWPEAVDDALCFGWIDGVRRSLGDEVYSIRFTPRKATSIWSAVNVDRTDDPRRPPLSSMRSRRGTDAQPPIDLAGRRVNEIRRRPPW